jgi:hypothetical protein
MRRRKKERLERMTGEGAGEEDDQESKNILFDEEDDEENDDGEVRKRSQLGQRPCEFSLHWP